MALISKSSLATIALATGLVLASGAGGAVAGGMITGKQIKNNTVTTKDIKNGSLLPTDLDPQTLTSLKGAQGTPGLSGYVRVTETKNVAANTPSSLTADCPVGTKVLSVAGHWATSSAAVQTVLALGNDARGAVYTTGVPVQDELRIQLICATVG